MSHQIPVQCPNCAGYQVYEDEDADGRYWICLACQFQGNVGFPRRRTSGDASSKGATE